MHDPNEGSQSSKGWDFGLVGLFKSAFNAATDVAYEQSLGRLRDKLGRSGITLADDQLVIVGQNILKRTPGMGYVTDKKDEGRLTLKVAAVTREVAGFDVALADVEIVGADLSLYDLAMKEAHPVAMRALKVGKLELKRGNFTLTGSVTITDLVIDIERVNVTAVVTHCFKNGFSLAIAELESTSGGARADKPSDEWLTVAVHQEVMTRLTDTLKLIHNVGFGGLDITVDIKQSDKPDALGIRSQATLGKTQLALDTDGQGPQLLGRIRGIDFGGHGKLNAGNLRGVLSATGVGEVDFDKGLLRLGKLELGIGLIGSLAGLQTDAEVSVDIEGIEFEATERALDAEGLRGRLLSYLTQACGYAFAAAYGEVVAAAREGEKPEAIRTLVAARIPLELQKALGETLEAKLEASIAKITAKIERLTVNGAPIEGALTLERLSAELGYTPREGATGLAGFDIAGGTASVSAFGLSVIAQVDEGSGFLVPEQGGILFPNLRCSVGGGGRIGLGPDYPPLDIGFDLGVRFADLTIATADIQSFYGKLAEAVAFVVSMAVSDAASADQAFSTDALVEVIGSIASNALADRLRANLTITMRSVRVDIRGCSVDWGKVRNVTASGTLEAGDVEMTLDLSSSDIAALEIHGGAVCDAIIACGGANLLSLDGVELAIDPSGNGRLTGAFKLHSPGAGKLVEGASNKVAAAAAEAAVKALNTQGRIEARIAAYQIDIGSLSAEMPSRVLAPLVQAVLSQVRIEAESDRPKIKLLGKFPVPKAIGRRAGRLSDRVDDMSEETGNDPVLVASDALGAASAQGAVNLRAFLQSVLQARLNAVRAALEDTGGS